MLTRSHKFAALFLIVALGLVLRLRGLDRVGFNEDEVHKVEAARAYRGGNFLVNLEHPMLMKSLITASLAAADSWNRGLGHSREWANAIYMWPFGQPSNKPHKNISNSSASSDLHRNVNLRIDLCA